MEPHGSPLMSNPILAMEPMGKPNPGKLRAFSDPKLAFPDQLMNLNDPIVASLNPQRASSTRFKVRSPSFSMIS